MTDQISYYIDKFSNVYELISGFLVEYGFKILLALIMLYGGFKIIKQITKVLRKTLEKSAIETSLENFLASLVTIVLKLFLILFVVDFIGFPLTSFLAILGAAGLAVGLALQGSLSNFAGGVLILFLKPFKVGDYIKEQTNGHQGYVENIDIFYTTIRTVDNQTIVIPNGMLSSNSIINSTHKDLRRIDLEFGASYSDSIDTVREAMLSVADTNLRVLKKPSPAVKVSAHGDNAVLYQLWAWVETPDYIPVRFELIEDVKKEFDRRGISIPFPQVDLHVVEDKTK